MSNQDKVFKQLEMIKKEYGIEAIEEFVKKSKQNNRKRRGRPRSGLMTGAEVYFELFGFNFENQESYQNFSDANITMSITEAKENVSIRKGTEVKTVDKQVTEINKYAKKIDYTEFCIEFDNFRQDRNFEEWNANDIDGMHNHILGYGNEKQEYNKNTQQYFTKGDYRYAGIDIRLAIALFLKYKYDKSKNAHKVPKKTDDTPCDIPQQQRYYQPQQQQQYVPQSQNNDDKNDIPF